MKHRGVYGVRLRHAMNGVGVTGTYLHGRLSRGGVIVSLQTVYNWMRDIGPGPDAKAVRVISKVTGRSPQSFYRKPTKAML